MSTTRQQLQDMEQEKLRLTALDVQGEALRCQVRNAALLRGQRENPPHRQGAARKLHWERNVLPSGSDML